MLKNELTQGGVMKKIFLLLFCTFIASHLFAVKEDCDWQEKWDRGDKISNGKYGNVYEATEIEDASKSSVIKVQLVSALFRNEAKILVALQKLKFPSIPKIKDIWTCKGTGYIAMEKLEPCTTGGKLDMNQYFILLSFVRTTIRELNRLGYFYKDIHKDNIMRKGGKFYFIDFGNVIYVPKTNYLMRETQEALQEQALGQFDKEMMKLVKRPKL